MFIYAMKSGKQFWTQDKHNMSTNCRGRQLIKIGFYAEFIGIQLGLKSSRCPKRLWLKPVYKWYVHGMCMEGLWYVYDMYVACICMVFVWYVYGM